LGYLGSYDVRHKPNINQSTENIQGALNDWRVASLVYSTRSETKKNNEKKLKNRKQAAVSFHQICDILSSHRASLPLASTNYTACQA